MRLPNFPECTPGKPSSWWERSWTASDRGNGAVVDPDKMKEEVDEDKDMEPDESVMMRTCDRPKLQGVYPENRLWEIDDDYIYQLLPSPKV